MNWEERISIWGQLSGALIVFVFFLVIDAIMENSFDLTFLFLYWDIMLGLILGFHYAKKQQKYI